MRNKDNHAGNWGGHKGLNNPKAKPRFAPLKPNGQIAMQPQERMRKGNSFHSHELGEV
jgi:hypothetical protein